MVFVNQTVTPPIFADEWKLKPPIYHRVDNYAVHNNNFDDAIIFGQYITSTNLLPKDEKKVRLFTNLTQSREYINDRFTFNDIDFRNSISHIYKQKLLNRYRHNQ